MIQFLLARGASVHARDSSGLTPLHLAAACGSASSIDILLTAGVDVNAVAAVQQGMTALSFAAQHAHAEAVELLLRRGAAVSVPGTGFVAFVLVFAADN